MVVEMVYRDEVEKEGESESMKTRMEKIPADR